METGSDRSLFLGFVKLHILYHAGEGRVFGLEMIRELARHGYDLSPGTLYPLLHRMAGEGLLAVKAVVAGGRTRKYYSLTPAGAEALAQGRARAGELLREIGE